MLVVLVVLVVLALEDRLEVATRVLEDVLEVKLSVSPRSAMVSELSIVLAPQRLIRQKHHPILQTSGKATIRAKGAKGIGMIEIGKVT